MLVSVLSRTIRPQPVAAETVIDAVAVTDNATGTALVQIFCPLPPGLMSDQMMTERKFAVLVNGVEQAVFVKASRGRFPAGFLGASGGESIQAVQGHFTYNLPDTTPVAMQFIVDRTRTTSDLTETTITDAHISARRIALPTSPAYLCSTWFTMQPLVPVAQLNAQNLAYYSTQLNARFQALKNDQIDAGNYTSTYESSVALFAYWCMSGDREYFWQAWRRSRGFLNYSLPNNGANQYSPEPNPQSIVTGVTGPGLPNEQNSQRLRTFACAYRATGQIAFWNLVGIADGWTNWAVTSESVAAQLDKVISGDEYGRFNLRGQWAVPLRVLIDSTKGWTSVAGGWTGRSQGGASGAPVEIPWNLNAWDVNRFNLNDYRDDMRGSNDTATSAGTTPAGEYPHFQWALSTDWLLFIYLNVLASPTIAGWIKTNVDVMLGNLYQLQDGDEGVGYPTAVWGYDYKCTSTQGRRDGPDPWTLGMWAATVKFCEKYFGNNVVNGATYATWYTRLIDVDQFVALTFDWKIIGEQWGNTMLAPYLDQYGIPSGLPSTIRAPTQY